VTRAALLAAASAVAIGTTPLIAQTDPSVRAGYAEVNGLRMYYEVHGGGGHPLVLVHGGGSTIQTSFGAVLPGLARTRQVIAVETQGHGHTADIDRPLSFAQDADDVAALLRELGIGSADVFGYSNGANVAMEMGIRHPALVRRLVVASTVIRNDGLQPGILESFFQPASPESMPPELRAAYLAAAPRPQDLPALVDKLMARMRGFADMEADAVRSIRAPTLVLTGDADVGRPEHAVEMFRLLPNAQLAILPGTDHVQMVQRADALLALIPPFLDAPDPR
jgi:pimeloyl-ACP methyl ester carboxylesterase